MSKPNKKVPRLKKTSEKLGPPTRKEYSNGTDKVGDVARITVKSNSDQMGLSKELGVAVTGRNGVPNGCLPSMDEKTSEIRHVCRMGP